MFEVIDKPVNKVQWGELGTAAASIIIALASSNIPSASWLIWVCVPIFLVSFSLLVLHSPFGDWAVRKWREHKSRKILSANLSEYEKIFERSQIAGRIVDKLDRMEWGELRPPSYINSGNRMNDAKETLRQIVGPAYVRFLFINSIIKDYADYIDGYLKYADRFIVNRAISYRCESEKTEMLHLVSRYQHFKDQHDEFVSEVNDGLRSVSLFKIYGHIHSFTPKEQP